MGRGRGMNRCIQIRERWRYKYSCPVPVARPVDVLLHSLLASALAEAQWSASLADRLSCEKCLRYSLSRKQGGLQGLSGCLGAETIRCLCPKSIKRVFWRIKTGRRKENNKDLKKNMPKIFTWTSDVYKTIIVNRTQTFNIVDTRSLKL